MNTSGANGAGRSVAKMMIVKTTYAMGLISFAAAMAIGCGTAPVGDWTSSPAPAPSVDLPDCKDVVSPAFIQRLVPEKLTFDDYSGTMCEFGSPQATDPFFHGYFTLDDATGYVLSRDMAAKDGALQDTNFAGTEAWQQDRKDICGVGVMSSNPDYSIFVQTWGSDNPTGLLMDVAKAIALEADKYLATY